jgi:DNA-directed RNA polymerase subunit RPC12/RpoP
VHDEPLSIAMRVNNWRFVDVEIPIADAINESCALYDWRRFVIKSLGMAISFVCPWCTESISVDDSKARERIECPHCNRPVKVPAKSTHKPPPPPPSSPGSSKSLERAAESRPLMTSTIKRRIARELLIFLLCAVIGLFIAYYVLYFHQRHYIPNLNDYHGDYIQDEGVNAIPYRYETPGDMFRDLYSGAGLKSWLYILTPYFALCFVRSIIWLVNALRRNKPPSP